MNPKRTNRTLKHIIVICTIITSIVLSNVLYTMITKTHLRTGVNLSGFARESELSRTLSAQRGNIYDRGGEVIAQDETTYTLYAILNSAHLGIGGVAEYVMDAKMTAEKIAPILGIDVDIVLNYLELGQASNFYQTEFGSYGKNIPATKKEAIDALELPGIAFTKSSMRSYPTGKFASHLIGYAQFDEQEKRIVGKMGIEEYLDEYLKGSDGEERYRATASGTSIPGSKHVTLEAQNGNDVYLTLDKNVQVALEQAMAGTMEMFESRRAWGIIVEVETGKILGYSAYPTFDLNDRKIEDYVNVPTQYLYEPGSVMKGITYAAAIDTGNYPAGQTYRSGTFHMASDADRNPVRTSEGAGTTVISDALGKDYGTITFEEGFARSSNIAICELLANYMSPDILSEYLDRFGFFKNVGMEGVVEEAGTKNFTWAADKLSSGFGQASSVTAMQMVQAYSAIFNDGKMVKPYYIDKVINSSSKEIVKQGQTEVVGTPISKETSKKMIELMDDVVNEEYGSGYTRFHMDDMDVIGKTGTGEMVINGSYDSKMYVNSFMAAAPASDPKVMMYYVFESSHIKYDYGEYFKSAFRQAMIAEGITGLSQDSPAPNSSWQEYTMPSLVNHRLDYANEKTKTMNLSKVIIGDGVSVVAQYPNADETIVSKQNVFLLTDGGTITMPNMSGWSRKDVRQFAELTKIPLLIEGNGNVSEQSIPANEVITSSEIKITLK